jgi:hypothetical protein
MTASVDIGDVTLTYRGGSRMTKSIDLPRPRDLDICFEARFTDIVHELRAKIAEVRKA